MTSPHVQLDPQDAVIIDAIAEHMRRILDAFRSFGRECPTWKVADESQLGKERERLLRHIGPGGAWTSHAADYVSDAGLLFLLAQSDHLHVLRQIYSSYSGLMFGLGPPARSLLELNGYVYWLLHPDVQSIRTRASRALLSRLNDATRERSVAKDLGAPDRHLSPLGQLVRELKDQCQSSSIHLRSDGTSRVVHPARREAPRARRGLAVLVGGGRRGMEQPGRLLVSIERIASHAPCHHRHHPRRSQGPARALRAFRHAVSVPLGPYGDGGIPLHVADSGCLSWAGPSRAGSSRARSTICPPHDGSRSPPRRGLASPHPCVNRRCVLPIKSIRNCRMACASACADLHSPAAKLAACAAGSALCSRAGRQRVGRSA